MTSRTVGPWPDGQNVMAAAVATGPVSEPAMTSTSTSWNGSWSGNRRAVVAHRGDSGHRPENTAAAFRAAVELGVECIELDVHLSRDEALVVIHDGTVDRTSNGQGVVAELTLDQIRAMDAGSWMDQRFAGEPFLTLDEALDCIPAPVRLNVHIKAYEETRDRVTVATVSRLRERELLDRAYLASDEATLHIARELCPGIEICNLSIQPAETYVERSAASGCRILQPGHGMTTRQLVESAHAHEMLVYPFFADEEDQMRRLLDCGADGMLTNEPARLQALLTAYNPGD